MSTKVWSIIHFTPSKIYAYLLYFEKNDLVFLETLMKFDEIDEFDEIIITFTDQNDTLLEIEDKFNLILLINK